MIKKAISVTLRFDALICAAARHLDLALLTRDADIRQSGLVRVIW